MEDCMAWNDGCPQSITLSSAEFPAPSRERIIPCLFALICFEQNCAAGCLSLRFPPGDEASEGDQPE